MVVHGATLLGTYLGSECHFQLSGFWVTPVLMPEAWATRPCPAMPRHREDMNPVHGWITQPRPLSNTATPTAM